MKILINPGNIQNAKSYPYWEEFLELVKDQEVKQIKGILPEQEIIDLVNWCDKWISIDSFLPHLCKYHNLKSGIVIWGKSDPLIFGYPENVNLIKDRNRLRPDQFVFWTNVKWDKDDFIIATDLIKSLNL